MDRFWSLKSAFGEYDFTQLIDTRVLEAYETDQVHVVCDIDKTYLETKFETKIQMIKIAFEDAKDKITVSGASTFLSALRWGAPQRETEVLRPVPVHFISASPPQLRTTLEEKLSADGIDWTSDSFKNQAYNLRKGRLDLLRHHVAYKTATIYRLMQNAPDASKFILIGDNAEFDTYIYMGLFLFLEGKFTTAEYINYLLAGGVQNDVVKDIEKLLLKRPKARVTGILIREAPGYETIIHPKLKDYVFTFGNYFQALLKMIHLGFIDSSLINDLVKSFHNQSSYSREELISHLACFSKYSKSDKVAGFESTIQELKEIGALNEIPEQKNYFMSPSLQDLPEGQELLKIALEWSKMLSKDH